MKPIWLFLQTFRGFIKDIRFKSENERLPVFYYEDKFELWFYKFIEGTLFYTKILKSAPPTDVTITILKNNEFRAVEIPEQLIKPKEIILTGFVGKPPTPPTIADES